MDNSVIINKNNFKKSADTILFDIPSAENKEQGFLVWFDGEFKAYLNQCRHMDVCLDWQPNEFFDEDNKFIVCATHGALYQPQSGVCIAGPCNGKNLIAMPYEITNDFIVVTV